MSPRLVGWIVVVLAAMLLGVACGGAGSGTASGPGSTGMSSTVPSSVTNGLESMTSAQALRTAVDAIKAADSVHIVAKGTGTGQPGQLDLRMQGGSCVGSIVISGLSVDVTFVNDKLYLKTGQAGWTALGAPADVASRLAGKWARMPADMVSQTTLTIASLVDQLSKELSGLRPEVEQATVDGVRVVVITNQNGDKVYVANTGAPLPRRFTSVAEGEMELTEYGTDFHVTAPPDAIEPTPRP